VTKQDDGPFRYEHPALSEAIRASKLPRRKPDEGDHVPAAGPPMTKAQRIARDLQRGKL
jgi:hypothetical protein